MLQASSPPRVQYMLARARGEGAGPLGRVAHRSVREAWDHPAHCPGTPEGVPPILPDGAVRGGGTPGRGGPKAVDG